MSAVAGGMVIDAADFRRGMRQLAAAVSVITTDHDGNRAGMTATSVSSLTGVDAKIVVLLGNRFPMIRAHKVLAAYACLAPRIANGEFDLAKHRAVWPSTGNYCRGGVAISKILGCRGVAVLPEGMSQERFDWLSGWVTAPEDIVRTPGTESNVKEIYDTCAALERDSACLRHVRERLRARGANRGNLPHPAQARRAEDHHRADDHEHGHHLDQRVAGPCSGHCTLLRHRRNV